MLRPYIAVHVFDENEKLIEIRECPLVERGDGTPTYRLGPLKSGWNIVVEGALPEHWTMEME